ncbi:MAG: crossover junction endodeoxyribonuclease RuvC [Mariniblastus sp.]|nr:crossover junction endodeoxyribonuclease RuvC [Mariniblastus sp.]MDG2183844.1 crossover junction endodeoxyribonuclease RuvC [Mariniblastus sp.]
MTGSQETRVLGIDPGLNITGYGVISICDREISVVEAGVVRSKRTDSFPTRLNSIHQGITDVIEQLKPDCVGLEDLYSHYERPQTAIIMGHARGVISLAVGQNELPLHGYAATQIKKVLTGNGRAPKVQVQHAVARQLNLREIPEPADVADALAIALCHYFLTLRTATLT